MQERQQHHNDYRNSVDAKIEVWERKGNRVSGSNGWEETRAHSGVGELDLLRAAPSPDPLRSQRKNAVPLSPSLQQMRRLRKFFNEHNLERTEAEQDRGLVSLQQTVDVTNYSQYKVTLPSSLGSTFSIPTAAIQSSHGARPIL